MIALLAALSAYSIASTVLLVRLLWKSRHGMVPHADLHALEMRHLDAASQATRDSIQRERRHAEYALSEYNRGRKEALASYCVQVNPFYQELGIFSKEYEFGYDYQIMVNGLPWGPPARQLLFRRQSLDQSAVDAAFQAIDHAKALIVDSGGMIVRVRESIFKLG